MISQIEAIHEPVGPPIVRVLVQTSAFVQSRLPIQLRDEEPIIQTASIEEPSGPSIINGFATAPISQMAVAAPGPVGPPTVQE